MPHLLRRYQRFYPTQGQTLGNVRVTITGKDFVSGATVTIGGQPAEAVDVVNSTTITATTPAHPAGVVNVEVVSPDGQHGVLVNGYTYL